MLALFSAITAEDCILLDVADRPEYLIMTHIPVPPVCIRPSVEMDSGQGSNEDDLTVRLRVGTPPFLYLPGKSLYTFHLTQVPHTNCLPLVYPTALHDAPISSLWRTDQVMPGQY